MNHRQLVSAVARRFPDMTQRKVEEVLEVLIEVWNAELAQAGGEVVIRDFGQLTVEVQQIRASGVIRSNMGTTAPERLTRLYFRFRPTHRLREDVNKKLKESV